MDVKVYMSQDIQLIDDLVKRLQDHITKWDSDKVIEQAELIFDAFSKRFAIEDFLLLRLKTNRDMQDALVKFLKIRREFREKLESLLTLHVDEPDFHGQVIMLHQALLKHMAYLKAEFEPRFVDQVSAAQMATMANDLEQRALALSAS
ncbi:MAG: hypothetical protein IPP97_20015 [Candidatus Obscuribacter sp.]|nr:hypothetical protein [Candidatus Obscuribacter sp.]